MFFRLSERKLCTSSFSLSQPVEKTPLEFAIEKV